jgi:hypothetical protein
MKTQFRSFALGAGILCAAQLFASPGTQTVSVNFMSSGKIDLDAGTLTLPLQQGALKDGRKVWFVLTDTSDPQRAKDLGIAYAPDLSNAAMSKSTRHATLDSNGQFTFDSGTVDFKPQWNLVPGQAPNYFPPQVTVPGSVGDANYSPYVKVDATGAVYNAPILAFDVDASQISFCDGGVDHDLVHDKVVKICPQTKEVALTLSHGFASSQPVVYVSFDANVELAATMESSTYVPAFDDLKGTGSSLSIYAVANGEIGKNNPQRQGFDSALSGDGSPLNVLDGLPSVDAGYSPLWELYLGAWTDSAIQSGARDLLTSAKAVRQAVTAGTLTGPGGAMLGSTGILINCPVVAILQTSK